MPGLVIESSEGFYWLGGRGTVTIVAECVNPTVCEVVSCLCVTDLTTWPINHFR